LGQGAVVNGFEEDSTDCFVQAPQYLSSWLAVLKIVEIWC